MTHDVVVITKPLPGEALGDPQYVEGFVHPSNRIQRITVNGCLRIITHDAFNQPIDIHVPAVAAVQTNVNGLTWKLTFQNLPTVLLGTVPTLRVFTKVTPFGHDFMTGHAFLSFKRKG